MGKIQINGAMITRWCEAEQLVECMRTRNLDLLKLHVLGDARTRSLNQAENLIVEWLADPYNVDMARYFDI